MNNNHRLSQIHERRRQDLARLDEQTAKNGMVQGSSLFEAPTGAGEGFVELSFPVLFTERPIFTSGWVVDENEHMRDTVPRVSPGIIRWRRSERTDDRTYWTGALLGVRIDGWAGIHIWVDYCFSAVSLQNPTSGTGNLGEVL